jgi:ribosomal protein S18 acetylase RimI-like enzyme
MFIEVASEKQIELVESLAKEIWTEHYTPIIGRAQVDYMLSEFQSKQAIAEQIKSGALYFLIRTHAGFIGYVSFVPKRDELFLSKIYIEASGRGKGYGKKAVLFAAKIAKENGLDRIALTVNKNNLNSIKAYERLGFKNMGSVIQDIGHGFIMDDYRMEKILSGKRPAASQP